MKGNYTQKLYFTDSPVNILSETTLAESIKDDEGIWVQKKGKIKFYLVFWEVKKDNTSLRKISYRIGYPSWI